ncbi:MAG: hypothetical protein KatS3mg110_1627 [Pirellulaceae bacterium]|nr:MAG: hypothetical protein KatS3mg110_1627 [Pirellulaceae bacterium]
MAFLIEVANLSFSYPRGGFRLDIPSWVVPAGQSVALVGPSGSGKTTLLHLLAGIYLPQRGSVRVGQMNLAGLSERARRRFRLASLGLVFQEFELLDHLTVFENLLIPCRLGKRLPRAAEKRQTARYLAERLGLSDKLDRYPRALSQGERQRVAVGRALLLDPRLILADEPTGNLDPAAKQQVLSLFLERVQSGAATLIVATHDHQLLLYFHQVLDITQLVSWAAAGHDKAPLPRPLDVR